MRGGIPETDSRTFGISERAVLAAVICSLALKIMLLAIFAWHGRFVMDEFLQLGYAKYLGHQLFDTLWPPKAIGFAAFYKLAHLIGWDATSILLIGRMQTALLACGTLAMIYACARNLGESRLRALGIILVLLSFFNFLERIFRTIAEPLALFFAVAALLAVLRGRADERRTAFVAGILCGLSFLATQKAVYFDVALGVALVADAALTRRFAAGVARGAWLVLGWAIPLAVYCLVFGGTNPVPVAESLVFGPAEVASGQIAAEYGGLRHYVVQTLLRNLVLYAFCFAGMFIELIRSRQLDERRRIALFFSIVITLLVFAHNQPWPYVFIMALPFIALWALVPIDRMAADRGYLRLAMLALALSVAMSFVRNVQYLRFDNTDQLKLVERAEAMLAPGEVYFDGIGMLPNRAEPSTLWLDRHYVLKTLREDQNSEAYRIFASHPPKAIIWSYRMDGIDRVVAPLIRDSYVGVAPNLKIAGRQLRRGATTFFRVPVGGEYALYDSEGKAVAGTVIVDGVPFSAPLRLEPGAHSILLRDGPGEALLLPRGSYAGHIDPGPDNRSLFNGVYD